MPEDRLLSQWADDIGRWLEENFPDAPPLVALAALTEEVGELARAVVKDHQGIRGSHEGWVEEQRKECGDVFVTWLHLCRRLRIDPAEAVGSRWESISKRDWVNDPERGGQGADAFVASEPDRRSPSPERRGLFAGRGADEHRERLRRVEEWLHPQSSPASRPVSDDLMERMAARPGPGAPDQDDPEPPLEEAQIEEGDARVLLDRMIEALANGGPADAYAIFEQYADEKRDIKAKQEEGRARVENAFLDEVALDSDFHSDGLPGELDPRQSSPSQDPEGASDLPWGRLRGLLLDLASIVASKDARALENYLEVHWEPTLVETESASFGVDPQCFPAGTVSAVEVNPRTGSIIYRYAPPTLWAPMQEATS